ncbi:MAG: putative DNA binding domain-containing protein [Clostridia bacterium]
MDLESIELEYKKEYTADIKKTIIAFANTNGGQIKIGIDNDLNIIGVVSIDETMLKITNMIRDSVKPDVTMFIECKVEVISHKNIITIYVQKGTASPYYLAGKGIRPEGVFVRQGSSSAPASESAILKMIKETSGDNFEDVRSIEQNLSFDICKNEFEASTLSLENNDMKTLNIIGADGLYTNLALLLSDQCQHSIKAAIFEGTSKEVFKDRVEFDGSIFKQLHDCFDFIEKNIKTNAKIEGLKRVENRDYPQIAIREILLNSLVHRDYSYSSSILISIFDDRIEFVTVGGLIKGMTRDDILLGISILRNKNLANIFYRLHLIEAYGTGFEKINLSYQSHYGLAPLIEITDNAFKITIYNTNYQPLKAKTLTASEEKIINAFKSKGNFKRNDLEVQIEISQSMAIKLLKSLTKKGIVEKVGSGKNTTYIIK